MATAQALADIALQAPRPGVMDKKPAEFDAAFDGRGVGQANVVCRFAAIIQGQPRAGSGLASLLKPLNATILFAQGHHVVGDGERCGQAGGFDPVQIYQPTQAMRFHAVNNEIGFRVAGALDLGPHAGVSRL